MVISEAAKVQWIRENLNITHDDLIHSDAAWWFEMMETDFQTFLRLSIFGFALRMGVKGQKEIPPDVITSYIREFQYKICLAMSGDLTVRGLPLFVVAGVEVLGEELLKSTEAYRIHPGAEVPYE